MKNTGRLGLTAELLMRWYHRLLDKLKHENPDSISWISYALFVISSLQFERLALIADSIQIEIVRIHLSDMISHESR
jgi:hypothetical protein